MANAGSDRAALPEAWILPIRFVIYLVLAICSGYIYFNIGNLEVTHYLIILSIVAVSAMALLDCRMSEKYWKSQQRQQQQKTDDE